MQAKKRQARGRDARASARHELISCGIGIRDGRSRKPILSALAAEERAGIRLATFARLGALAIIGLWVATRAVGQAR